MQIFYRTGYLADTYVTRTVFEKLVIALRKVLSLLPIRTILTHPVPEKCTI